MSGYQQYLVKRLLLIIPTLAGITIILFTAVRFVPGDIVDVLAGEAGASPQFREAIEKKYSLSDSIPQQYATWVGHIFQGDLGTSIVSGHPVGDEIKDRLPITVELAAMAMIVSLTIAIPVGIVSAVRRDTVLDYVARSFSIGLITVPSFWIGIMAIVYGFIIFGWTPPLGYRNLWDDPWVNLKILWVPALILGGSLSGSLMRLTRSTMLEVLQQDYMRTAWAKGLSERVVFTRHATRNAIIPVFTIIGLRIPTLIGGTVILEFIFSIPGMGSYFLFSIQQRDYPVVQAIVLITAVIVVVSNLVVDLGYSLIDPRIRYS